MSEKSTSCRNCGHLLDAVGNRHFDGSYYYVHNRTHAEPYTSTKVTATIQIGNSDDKLTQAEWSEFVRQTDALITAHGWDVHFLGYPPGDRAWQNACWVIEIPEDEWSILKGNLIVVRNYFRQESVAVTIGKTEFV